LRNDELAGLDERGRKWRVGAAFVLNDFHHCRHAGLTLAACDIDVIRARLFERKPHEFPAALNRRPIIKFVTHPI
jgi:hypothetical protein